MPTNANIHEILSDTAIELADFLNEYLPKTEENWWENRVLLILKPHIKRLVKNGTLDQLDLSSLLYIFNTNWYDLSELADIDDSVRNYLKETQFIRNKWAHKGCNVNFSDESTTRDLDTLYLLLKGIRAKPEIIAKINTERTILVQKIFGIVPLPVESSDAKSSDVIHEYSTVTNKDVASNDKSVKLDDEIDPQIALRNKLIGVERLASKVSFTELDIDPDDADPENGMVNIGRVLHQQFNYLPCYRYDELSDINIKNGIYVFFEDGQTFRKYRRIVYVGYNELSGYLLPVILKDFEGTKNNSEVRKAIGEAILSKRNDPYLQGWLQRSDYNYIKNYAPLYDKEREAEIENEVSKYIQTHISVACISIHKKADRELIRNLLDRMLKDAYLDDHMNFENWLGSSVDNFERKYGGMWRFGIVKYDKQYMRNMKIKRAIDLLFSTLIKGEIK